LKLAHGQAGEDPEAVGGDGILFNGMNKFDESGTAFFNAFILWKNLAVVIWWALRAAGGDW
jgi:hypothetical protein